MFRARTFLIRHVPPVSYRHPFSNSRWGLSTQQVESQKTMFNRTNIGIAAALIAVPLAYFQTTSEIPPWTRLQIYRGDKILTKVGDLDRNGIRYTKELQQAEKLFDDSIQIIEKSKGKKAREEYVALLGKKAKTLQGRKKYKPAADMYAKQLDAAVTLYGRHARETLPIARDTCWALHSTKKRVLMQNGLVIAVQAFRVMTGEDAPSLDSEALTDPDEKQDPESQSTETEPQSSKTEPQSTKTEPQSAETEPKSTETESKSTVTEPTKPQTEAQQPKAQTEKDDQQYLSNPSPYDGGRVRIPSNMDDIELLLDICEVAGVMYRTFRSHSEAVKWGAVAFELSEKLYGCAHVRGAELINAIVVSLFVLGQHHNAVVLSRQALEICENVDNKEQLCATLYNLGRSLQEIDEKDEAKKHLKRALEVAQQHEGSVSRIDYIERTLAELENVE